MHLLGVRWRLNCLEMEHISHTALGVYTFKLISTERNLNIKVTCPGIVISWLPQPMHLYLQTLGSASRMYDLFYIVLYG